MDAREELENMRRLAALEAKMGSSFGDRAAESLFAGAQKTGAGIMNLPVLAGRGVNWLMDKAGVPNSPNTLMSRFTEPNYFDEVMQDAEKNSKSRGIQNPYGRAAVEGLGGGPLMVGSAGRPVAGMITSAIPPVAGEAAAQTLGEGARPWATLGTGLATGFFAGPKQSVAQADIRRELAGLPETDFAAANRNLQNFKDSGSTTWTAAEAFPGKGRILGLAGKANNTRGGEALAQRLRNREEDLQGLGETASARIGPAVDPNTVANQAGGAATANILQQKQMLSARLDQLFRGQRVPAPAVWQLYSQLQTAANVAERPAVAEAYRAVASRLLNQQNAPIENLQELSYAIKDLKTAAKNPMQPPVGGAAAMNNAIRDAEQGIAAISPIYRQGMAEFAQGQQALLGVKQGPLGSLSDKNPLLAGQTPVSRMEGLLRGNSPQTVTRTAQELGSPILTSGQPVAPRDIAQALVQNKLHKGSTNPGQDLRGMPGSGAEANLTALLDAGGVNTPRVMAPLRAADDLQKLSPAGAAGGLPIPNSGQLAIRPFRTLDMMLTGKSERDTQREIARLLGGNPDPGIIQELQRIAMFNPAVRRQLSAWGALQGAITNPSQEQQ